WSVVSDWWSERPLVTDHRLQPAIKLATDHWSLTTTFSSHPHRRTRRRRHCPSSPAARLPLRRRMDRLRGLRRVRLAVRLCDTLLPPACGWPESDDRLPG